MEVKQGNIFDPLSGQGLTKKTKKKEAVFAQNIINVGTVA